MRVHTMIVVNSIRGCVIEYYFRREESEEEQDGGGGGCLEVVRSGDGG